LNQKIIKITRISQGRNSIINDNVPNTVINNIESTTAMNNPNIVIPIIRNDETNIKKIKNSNTILSLISQ